MQAYPFSVEARDRLPRLVHLQLQILWRLLWHQVALAWLLLLLCLSPFPLEYQLRRLRLPLLQLCQIALRARRCSSSRTST